MAGCLLAFTLIVLFILIPTQIEQSVGYDLAGLAPDFFPKLSVFIILGLTFLLIIGHIRHFVKKLPPVDADVERLSGKEELRVGAAMAVSLLYYLSLEYLGFWIVNSAGVAAFLMIQDRSRILRQIFIAFLTTAAVYAFFHFVMRVHFPVGDIFK